MKVLYPGSFNPFHAGHQYVYDTACEMFGKENVYIGVGCSIAKFETKDNYESYLRKIKFTVRPITDRPYSRRRWKQAWKR